jgi:hypothetical protein
MEIPKKTNFNYIYLEAFDSYLEDKKVSEELRKEIWDFVSECVDSSINKERARWLGVVLREKL